MFNDPYGILNVSASKLPTRQPMLRVLIKSLKYFTFDIAVNARKTTFLEQFRLNDPYDFLYEKIWEARFGSSFKH
jgi:hypothetical protein